MGKIEEMLLSFAVNIFASLVNLIYVVICIWLWVGIPIGALLKGSRATSKISCDVA